MERTGGRGAWRQGKETLMIRIIYVRGLKVAEPENCSFLPWIHFENH